MKKYISLFISIIIIFSSVSTISYAEESKHWAYDTVTGLVSDGIVSGDNNGNLNLDNNITRAEFVKTVNKYFGLTEKSDISFPDVSENAWYYDDMLIAKKAGYIKGDQYNNANPNANITRSEVCVIITRLLNIEGVDGEFFTDSDEIPSWSKPSVNALYKKGIIKGYSDGSFCSGNPIKRAEAFVIISRNDRKINSGDSGINPGNNTSANNVFVPSPSKPSSGGGGGGGGGGGSGSNTTTVPSYNPTLSSRFFDKQAKKIEFVSENATKYKIWFSVDNVQASPFDKELVLSSENGNYKYADISELCNEVIRDDVGRNGFEAEIFIEAIGKNGESSGRVSFGKAFLEYDIPEVTGINMVYNPVTDGYDLTWTEVPVAEGYEVYLYSDKDLTNPPVYKYENISTNSYSIDTSAFEFNDTYYVAVVCKSNGFPGNPKGYCGQIIKGFGGGDGTEDNPYLIYSLNHINNIKLVNSKHFRQMVDITSESPVTDSITPLDMEFTGSYDGDNKKLYVNISSEEQTSDSNEGFGLFPMINNASFKNITLEGSVTGRGNVGGLVGRGTGKCLFENIKNNATVTSSTGYCGGITGRMYDGATSGTKFVNCVNYGEVKSFGNAAGIVGVSNATNVITHCANFGFVHSTNTNEGAGLAGGIIATAYGDIYNSYNMGQIAANKGRAGGIAGELAKPEFVFSNCFNAGTVTAYLNKAAIVTSSVAENVPVIKNSYNLDKTIKMYDGVSAPVYTDCITLNSSDTEAGLLYKTAHQLINIKLSDEYVLYSENDTNSEYNFGYRYPQLNGNLIPVDVSYTDYNFKMSITGINYDTETSKWYITINPTIMGTPVKYILSISGVSDTVITGLNDENKYEITDIPDGAATAVIAAYGENDKLLETSDVVSADFTFSGGIGTDESPYIITNAEQFVKAFGNGSQIANGKTYVLTGFDEIPLELPTDFKPLGTEFTGKLIGGNIVSGEIIPVVQKIDFNITTGKSTLNVDYTQFVSGTSTYKTQGILFHQLNGATIRNLSFHGSVNTPNTPSYFGVLAGRVVGESNISNIHNYAEIVGDQQRSTGGIIGLSGGNSEVKNCSNHGNIAVAHANTARADVGGIIGNMTATIITECYNYGDIQGRDNAGGIAGYSNCDIKYCGNYGNVSVTRDATYGYAGGISGRSNGGNISECFNAGDITSVKYAGGIFAHINSNKTSNVTNCFNIGTINGTTASGPVIGINQGTSTVSGFYDLKNTDSMSVCGINSGTLYADNAFGVGTVSGQPDDIENVSIEFIKSLTHNNNLFKDSSVWIMTDNYSYPNLVNNNYTGSDIVLE